MVQGKVQGAVQGETFRKPLFYKGFWFKVQAVQGNFNLFYTIFNEKLVERQNKNIKNNKYNKYRKHLEPLNHLEPLMKRKDEK